MKIIFTLIVILVIVIFVFRLFFLEPKIKRMFKKNGNSNRISISYAALFDVESIVKIIRQQLLKSKNMELYIQAYHVRKEFNNIETTSQIKQIIMSFQKQLKEEIAFDSMFPKDFYDILIEIWIRYSQYDNYRFCAIKRLYRLYKIKEINFIELGRLLLIFSGF